MTYPLRIAACLLLPALLTACRSPSQTHLIELRDHMTGSFNSTAQHEADPDNYYDIRLHMVPIWPERADGPWLYVEQAAASRLDQPYRQRVYRLAAREDGRFESIVYTLPDPPLKYAGAWKKEIPLADLTPDDLTLREGCSLILERQDDGSFVGSTVGTDCESTLRGAAFAISEATITPHCLISWDRGYDKNGKQVWGATAGGYAFVKETPAGAD